MDTKREILYDQSPAGYSFSEIYHVYFDRILRYACRFIPDQHEALDVTQMVFVRVYTRLPGFRGESSLTNWIYCVARSVCLNYLAAKRPAEPCEDVEQFQEPAESKTDPLMYVLSREDRTLIGRAIDSLPDLQRKIFILKVIHDWTYAEIASQLGRSEPAIRMGMSRARGRLREWFIQRGEFNELC